MDEFSKEVGKNLADEATKLLPQVYTDAFQPATKEIGSVLGRSTKALLSPLRGLLWGWERIEEMIINGVEKRLEDIPEENRKTPDPQIAVPLMQAISYTAQNDTLREMYLNLLAKSMDTTQEKNVHPSYVEIIKQMNGLDANLFQVLSNQVGNIKVVNPNIRIKGSNQIYIDATPEWFLDFKIGNYNIFDISASLIRLRRLGLIELMYDRTAGKDGYDNLKNSPILSSILNKYQTAYPTTPLEVHCTESILYVNEYGKKFAKSCL